ncbi:MAG: hypothetical protein LBL48_10595 [Azoarcus sp.]|jgi:hypothetical protein|nr:hypothetical protein [Azoarcus sp.]
MSNETAMESPAEMPPAISPETPAKPGATDSLLVWRTRESSRHLLMSMIYSLGIACATGIVLLLPMGNGHLTLIALVAHLVSGALALVFFIPFLFVHLSDGKEPLLHLVVPWRLLHRLYKGEPLYHRVLGYLLMWCLALTIATGLAIAAPAISYLAGRAAILPYGVGPALLRLHLTFSGLLVFFVLLHFPKRSLP